MKSSILPTAIIYGVIASVIWCIYSAVHLGWSSGDHAIRYSAHMITSGIFIHMFSGLIYNIFVNDEAIEK